MRRMTPAGGAHLEASEGRELALLYAPMNRRLSRVLSAISVSAATALCAATAAAHISLDQGGTHKSRYGDNFLKDGPCGMAGGTRGTNVYTYAPGATVPVSIVEFIPHPSYFRVAFDNDGDDGFVPP